MPSLSALAFIYLRIVNLTFGGGDPTMAALHREMVARRRWLLGDKYGLTYALARLTPGTNLLAFCAGTAWFLRGWWGAVVAMVASTVPSAVLIVFLTAGYQALKDNGFAAGAVAGTLAAAVGMMFAAAWALTRPGLRTRQWPRTLLLVAGSAVLLLVSKVPPIQVLGLAALFGFAWPGNSHR